MKEYLLIFRGGDTERKQLSPEQLQEEMKSWQDWIGGIAQTGKFGGGHPLAPVGKVLSGVAKKLTDGPFIEGKEIVGGYIVVKADSIEEATTVAEGCPNLNTESGTVEIREIGTMTAM